MCSMVMNSKLLPKMLLQISQERIVYEFIEPFTCWTKSVTLRRQEKFNRY